MISKIHKLLNKYLPEKYHHKIRVCPSTKIMLEEMKKRDGIKETLGQIERQIEVETHVLSANIGKYTAEFTERFPSRVKNRKSETFLMLFLRRRCGLSIQDFIMRCLESSVR